MFKRSALAAAILLAAGSASAQSIVTGATGSSTAVIQTPPSVGNGVANGVVKPAGSPSVNNGVSNGVVKPIGAPSVGDGIGNGVAKSPTVLQQTQ